MFPPARTKAPEKQGFFYWLFFTDTAQAPRSVTITKYHESLLNEKYDLLWNWDKGKNTRTMKNLNAEKR